MSKETPKRFEDWYEVDCNECERYWLNQCDGAKCDKTLKNGSKMPCNSFLATRSVIIPLQIKRLQKAIKTLIIAMCVLGILNIGIIVIIYNLFINCSL